MWRTLMILALTATACSEPKPAAAPEPAKDEAEQLVSASELSDAKKREGEASCQAACDHITTCAGATAATDCMPDCRENLIGDSGVVAMRYAACVESLDCPTVSKSVAMNMGPLGGCRLDALRAAR